MRRFYTAEIAIETVSEPLIKYVQQQFIFGTRNERDSFTAMIDNEPGMQVVRIGVQCSHTTTESLKACRAIRDC